MHLRSWSLSSLTMACILQHWSYVLRKCRQHSALPVLGLSSDTPRGKYLYICTYHILCGGIDIDRYMYICVDIECPISNMGVYPRGILLYSYPTRGPGAARRGPLPPPWGPGPPAEGPGGSGPPVPPWVTAAAATVGPGGGRG